MEGNRATPMERNNAKEISFSCVLHVTTSCPYTEEKDVKNTDTCVYSTQRGDKNASDPSEKEKEYQNIGVSGIRWKAHLQRRWLMLLWPRHAMKSAVGRTAGR